MATIVGDVTGLQQRHDQIKNSGEGFHLPPPPPPPLYHGGGINFFICEKPNMIYLYSNCITKNIKERAVQSNISTTATLGMEESDRCGEVTVMGR